MDGNRNKLDTGFNMSNNRKLAEIFYRMSEIFEIKDSPWESRAYQKAARNIESLSTDVGDIYKKGRREALMEIPGVGKALAEKIEQFLLTGKVEKYEEVVKSIPSGLIDMLEIPGMGPKKISKLYKKLEIDNIEKLEKAAKSGEIQVLEGFGEKSEKDILSGIDLLKRGRERMVISQALPIAREIIEYMKKNCKSLKSIEIAGSTRRRKETVGDFDILAISDNPKEIMGVFVNLPNMYKIEVKGDTKSTIVLEEGLDCDLRVLPEKSFGAALNYFTGSKEHNVRLRQIAITKGLKLSEYGLFQRSGKQIAGKTEEEIYKALGMSYIEPEMRENMGEIELAQKNKLPKLVAYDSIKGDLHIHTKYSDGQFSPEEMVRAAIKIGYKYVAITDHSKAERQANGMDEKVLDKYLEELDKLQKKYPQINIIKGAEVSILRDGSLDYTNQTLKKLDLVVASIHSGFKMKSEEMTSRITNALSSGFVDILGHPTGRIVNRREPFEVNLDKVFEKSKEMGVVMEINSTERLDLRDFHIRKAKDFGLKFCINTDSHHTDHLKNIEFGIAQARRGWLEEKDVVNTWDWDKLQKTFKLN